MCETVAAETAPATANARLVDHLHALDAGGGVDIFVTLPSDRMASPVLADQHVDGLIDELILLEPHLPARPKAKAVFLSGAANRLTRDGMVKLFEALRHVFPFSLASRSPPTSTFRSGRTTGPAPRPSMA